jgi:hypothetical protein
MLPPARVPFTSSTATDHRRYPELFVELPDRYGRYNHYDVNSMEAVTT